MDELYDLEFHRAMEAAYKRQLSRKRIEVYEADYQRFTELSECHGVSMAQLFHTLLRHYG